MRTCPWIASLQFAALPRRCQTWGELRESEILDEARAAAGSEVDWGTRNGRYAILSAVGARRPSSSAESGRGGRRSR